MDDQAFRRERMLASGLLREAAPAELALMARMREEAEDQRRAQAQQARSPAPSSLPPRPAYRPEKRARATV
ncbi:hypothetical protein HB662_21435 [Roseomonas frigidaquae]|uniref:Uncharacterized protein n=1 Tax=Falsiroseomonas frigidaquae TaxID=487318 RepID=A0ABX1F4U0_9PROT|nr:hypothetical protein [Falsiroseomonas frigidaquae]NKE47355.1 hypothetical protein [Falsiroseomonas frigidaquae]